MKLRILAIGMAISGFLVPGAFAQQDVPGEGRAAPSKSQNKAQKDEARKQRQAAGKDLAKQDAGRLVDTPAPAGAVQSITKEEKAAARAERKAKGAQAVKAPRQAEGPN